MALETLKDITEIGGFEVGRFRIEDDDATQTEQLRKYIVIRNNSAIGFRIQNGPIKEVGVNGCQIDAMIETVILILTGLNDKFTCEENSHAIACLKHAIFYLEERKRNREERGVEGQSLP